MSELVRAGRDALGARRIAVVTTSLRQGTNDVWEATREHVGDLLVIGASGTSEGAPAEPGQMALDEVGGRRGLIWRHLVGLHGTLRSFRPDLVHVNGELWGVTAQELLHLPSRTIVHGAENIWEHGNTVEQVLRRRLVARAVSRIAGYASWNHAGAEHVRGVRRELGLPDLPTLVLPGIIPSAPFRTTSWEPPPLTDSAPLEIVLVGRLVEMKGFQDAIEAAARLPRGRVRIRLCGWGPMRDQLVGLAHDHGVHLEVLGWRDPITLSRVMAASHVLVQPSLTRPDVAEQFGRAVAEAMTIGLPCIVSDSGELPRVVAGGARTVFAEGDVGQLGDRLALLVEDPSILTALSVEQRSLAARYQPAAASEAMLDLWAQSIR